MKPIFHLSIPVRDLDEAIGFYRDRLGAQIGRRTEMFADALLFGAQITLQNDPGNVSVPMPRTRHFGATLAWDKWETTVGGLEGKAAFLEPPKASYVGEPIEQIKCMIADPSGNRIELKAYRNPEKVLGSLAS